MTALRSFTVLPAMLATAGLCIFSNLEALPAEVQHKVNPRDGLIYVWVAPGTFQMGCSSDDFECRDNEKPAHTVTLMTGFWMGQTEVTQEAYKTVIGKSPSHFKSGNQAPVDSVWWDDARAYCEAVGMRLPTEAEWEYAARGGNPAPRYAPLAEAAWFSENSGGTSQKVARKVPNAFGLYDMLGNVWEWVADGYGPYSPTDATDPKPTQTADQHVLRGGSCFHDATMTRVSTRGWGGSGRVGRPNDYGFRCASASFPPEKPANTGKENPSVAAPG